MKKVINPVFLLPTFCVGFLVAIIIAQAGDPVYTITTIAMDEGIEYSVNMTAGFRSDVIYKTMDADTAWVIWYGMCANRDSIGYVPNDDNIPNIYNGVYTPKDPATKVFR